jgi:hypothetical protein
MNTRRDLFGAAVRLGFVLSTVAVILTLIVSTLGDVSPAAMAGTVAAVGFATSWVLTGRIARPAPVRSHHRVSVVHLRQPVG